MNRKTLEDRLKVLGGLIPDLQDQISADQRRLDKWKNERENIVSKLATGSPNGVSVSDHALLRYLERSYGLNLDSIRADILTPDRITAIEAGANSIKFDGVEMVVKGQTVVTVK